MTANWEDVKQYFGEEFTDSGNRAASYELIEQMVENAPRDKNGLFATEESVEIFTACLTGMSDGEIAFLLVHSGFIPDHYGDDSSEETLYSKLVEVLVAEAGNRIGLTTSLPSAKASTEYVTFNFDDSEVVVCDVKSYRLGRSQKAPNVKDVIKAEDYSKWIKNHKSHTPIGGLVVFPSRFDFSRGSDVYLYASNPFSGKRILILFFEHLAFFVLNSKSSVKGSFFRILENYEAHFKEASRDRNDYWNAISPAIEKASGASDLDSFLDACSVIIDDHVRATMARIKARIAASTSSLKAELEDLSSSELRERLLVSELTHRTEDDAKRLKNIGRFRL